MSITIRYKTVPGQELTPQQTLLLQGNYQKEFYQDNELKKIEFYDKNNDLCYLEYHIDNTNDLSSKIDEVTILCGGGCFYFNKVRMRNYVIWDKEVFSNHVKLSTGKVVLDSFGREIACREFDVTTLEVISTTKTAYLENLWILPALLSSTME